MVLSWLFVSKHYLMRWFYYNELKRRKMVKKDIGVV